MRRLHERDARAAADVCFRAPSDFWTGSKVAELKRLWAEGRSGSAIAALLGTTRNAAIGKAYRLGLAGRAPRRRYESESVPSRVEKPSRTMRNRRPSASPNLETGLTEPAPLNVALVALERGMCRWPHGEAPFVFCGHRTDSGAVYCPFHAAKAVRPYEARQLAEAGGRRRQAA